MGLVALAAVARDKAENREPAGRDFGLRLSHWLELLESDPTIHPSRRETAVQTVLQMIEENIQTANDHWDEILPWPDLSYLSDL